MPFYLYPQPLNEFNRYRAFLATCLLSLGLLSPTLSWGQCTPQTLASWSLNQCLSGTDASSYAEFTAVTNATGGACATVTASTLSRNLPSTYWHSCTYGATNATSNPNGDLAMCMSGSTASTFNAADATRLNTAVTVTPNTGSAIQVSSLQFYVKSPASLVNIGTTALTANNQLSKVGVSITNSAGINIYTNATAATITSNWTLVTVDLSADPDFTVSGAQTFNISLVGYAPLTTTQSTTAWEIDAVRFIGCCGTVAGCPTTQATCGGYTTFQGNVSHITIGNTMSYAEDMTNCTQKANSAATLNIPAGSQVVAAYLYWSGSGAADNAVTLNSTNVTATSTQTDYMSTSVFYGANANITSLVQATGSATYTLSNLTWSSATAYCNSNSAYGAWAMVVVYQNNTLPSSTIHIGTDFSDTYTQYDNNRTISCVNFAAGCTTNAQLTLVGFETDNYKGEYLYINGTYMGDNNFRGQTGPNLDILTFNTTLSGTSLNYNIQTYTANTVWGVAIEGMFDYVRILKYNNCSAACTVTCSDITAGTIGSNQTICSTMSDPAPINSMTNASTTYAGGVKYIWKQYVGATAPSSSTAAGVTTIAGATGASYDPPMGSVTATTWFRRCAAPNSPSCTTYSGESNWVSITPTTCTNNCSNITNIYQVTSTNDNCGVYCNNYMLVMTQYGGCFTANNIYMIEYSNGTATIQGTATNYVGVVATINVTLSGKTCTGTPHYDHCTLSGGGSWCYYTTMGGTISVPGYPILNIASYMYPFQMGNGANLQESLFGASGWFTMNGIAHGDFNLRLTPVAALSATASNACVGTANNITLNVAGGIPAYTYLWSNGATSQNLSNVANGTYTVTVTDANGCYVTASATANCVNCSDITAGSIGSNQTICSTTGDPAAINSITNASTAYSGGVKYIWKQYVGATAPSSSTAAGVTTVVGATGASYDPPAGSITATTWFRRCAAPNNSACTTYSGESNWVSIGISPISSGINAPSTVCALEDALFQALSPDATFTYTWNFGPNATPATATGTSATAQFSTSAAGTAQNVTLTVSKNGCTATYNHSISVTPAVFANAGPDKEICQGGTTQIGGLPAGPGGATFTWSPNAFLNSSTVANPMASPPTTTTYTLSTTLNGCTRTDQVTVVVNVALNPNANAGAAQTVCAGQSIQIGGNPTSSSSGVTYVWSPANSLSNAYVANPTAYPTTNTTYSVLVTNASGCTATSSAAITLTTCAQPALTINSITVNENAGTATLQICTSSTSTSPITVTYTTTNSSAVSGSDYTTTTGTATIPAGQTCVNVTVPLIDDFINEPTETLNVILSNPSGATINNGTGVITILDNDIAPTPTLSINDVVVTEGTNPTATLQICASGTSTSPMTVTYTTSNGSATSGSDYTTTTGTATIPAGQTCVTVTVPIVDDNNPETTETFNVILSNPSGTTISDGVGIVTILDTDSTPTPTLSINDVIVTEGTNPTATLQICASSTSTSPITVTYTTSNGSATSGSDYTTTTATATIPAGQTCVNVTVPIIDDNNPESTETFNVILSNPSGATINDGTGVVTILDTDSAGAIVIGDKVFNDLNNNGIQDAGEPGIQGVQINLYDAGGWVGYTVSDANGNYTFTSATNQWIVAGSYRVCFNPLWGLSNVSPKDQGGNDALDSDINGGSSPNCTDFFTVSSGSNLTIDAGFNNGIVPTTPTLSINDVTVTEGVNPTATLQICASSTSTSPITVTYTTSNVSAMSGSDYTTTTATATIPAGQTCVNVTVPIVNDTNPETPETFNVTLSNPSGATINDGTGVVTILDNDNVSTPPTLSINDVIVTEGTNPTATLQICASSTSTSPITVTYTTSNGSAMSGSDYTTTTATATIPAGQTCVNVTVPIVDDNNPESTETFNVTLSNPSGATINDGTGVVTILDTDSAGAIVIGDKVFNDLNNNGIQDAGEAGIQGVQINLYDAGGWVGYTVSDANGNYTFTSATNQWIVAGSYRVCFNPLWGLSNVSPKDQGSNDALDSDINGGSSPNCTDFFTVSSGSNLTIDAGFNNGIVPTTPTLSINDVTVTEGVNPTATLQICASSTSTSPITVTYTTSNVSAMSGSDYTTTTATATIPAGQTCVNVTVPIVNDTNPETPETFNVTLSNPSGATINDGTGVVTILDNDNVSTPPTLSINDVIVTEGTSPTATLQICASSTSTSPITVTYTTSNGSAMSGSDYSTMTATATIPAGQTCVNVTVPIIDDNNPESTETFNVTLSNPSGATINDGTGVVTILDTDSAGAIVIGDKVFNDLNNNGIQDAGEPGIQGVQINLYDAGGWVGYTVSDANGNYTFSSATNQWIVAGSYRVCFNPLWGLSNVSPKDQGSNDALDSDINGGSSPNCTDFFTVSSGSNLTIDAGFNNGIVPTTPTLSINDVTVTEGVNPTATLQICASSTSTSPITVTYTTSNVSAMSGSDYTTTTATATIPAGQTCVNVTVPIVNDTNPETPETFNVTLSNPSGATINDGTGVVTILDNDNVSTPPTLSINDVIVTEGTNPTATLQICASSTSTSPITVTYTTSNGSATSGSDYSTMTATATIPAGQTCVNVTVPIVDDNNPESTETFNVTLSNPSGATINDGTGVVTILDTDSAGAIVIGDKVFNDLNNNGIQDAGEAGIQGVQINLYDAGGWVGYTVSDANGNYTFTSATNQWIVAGSYRVCFNPLWGLSNVSPKDQGSNDALDSDINGGSSPNCTDFFTVSSGSNLTIDAGFNNGIVPTTPTLSINDVTVTEGVNPTATLQICASSTSTSPITVTYTTSNVSAMSGSDYTTTTATATIPAGQTCVNVTVPIVNDTNPETPETFNVTLSNPSGATINDGTGVVTILDNDNVSTPPTLSINDVIVTEGTNPTATLQICASSTSTSPITVTYTTSNGSATSGSDYSTMTATATIPAGQTCVNVTVPIIDDNNPESTETFNVTLSNPSGATINDGTGVVTILDTDTSTGTCNNVTYAGSVGYYQANAGSYNPEPIVEASAATGGSGTLEYVWQVSTDNWSWTTIAGATGISYDPSTISTTTYYRRGVRRSNCSEYLYSSSVMKQVDTNMTVNCNDVQGGAIGYNQSICAGGDPAPIVSITDATTSQAAGVRYQWFKFVGPLAPADPLFIGEIVWGADGPSYDPPQWQVWSRTWYRRCAGVNDYACNNIYPGETEWTMVDVVCNGKTDLSETLSPLQIAPVPANNYAVLNFDVADSETLTIEVVDLSGRVVLQQQYAATAGNNSTELDISQLLNGYYMVRVTNDRVAQQAKLVIVR
jgi:hypothetical protein